ncbi:MAG: CHAT domain-containing protein [Gemmataceae bacterium]|nr:CHAT domain-containing protein [Gemmataceae bacterium]
MRRLLSVLAALSLAAAPIAKPDARQRALLEEARRFAQEAGKLWEAGKGADALAAWAKVVKAEEAALGPLSQDRYGSLKQLADWHEKRREWPAAEATWLQALAVAQRLHGEGDWRATDARLNVADARALAKADAARLGRIDRCREAAKKADALEREGRAEEEVRARAESVKLAGEAMGRGHPLHVVALNNLGQALRRAGRPAEAGRVFAEALSMHEANLGWRHPHSAATLSNLASAHQERGDYAAALPLFQRALARHLACTNGWDRPSASHWNNLAVIRQMRGELREAEDALLRAVEIQRAVPGLDPSDSLVLETNLATLAADLGRPREALALVERVQAGYRRAFGENDLGHTAALGVLARCQSDTGDNGTALANQRRALRIFVGKLGRGHAETALARHNLASLLRDLGDRKEASLEAAEALRVRVKVLGEKHPYTLTTLNIVASLAQEEGRLDEARKLFERCVAGHRAIGSAYLPSALNNLAVLEDAADRPREAISLIEEAIRRTPDPNGFQAARRRCNLAELLTKNGRDPEAHALYRRGLADFRRNGAERTHDYADALSGLSGVLARSRKTGAAILLAEQASAITRRHVELAAGGQSERQQLATLRRMRDFLDRRLSLPGLAESDAYRAVVAWKGIVFARQARQRRLAALAGAGEEATALVRDLDRTTGELSTLASEAASARSQALARRREELEAALARFGAAAEPDPDPARLASSLPRGAVLVDYLAYRRIAWKKAGSASVPSLAAWIVRSGQRPIRAELGPMKPIDDAVLAWRRDLQGDGGKAVRRLVVEPLAKHLAGAELVLLSPDGALNLVPFAALPGAAPGRFWLEEAALATLPVPRLLAERPAPPAGAPSLAVVGALEFGKGRWAALPATKPEAEGVAERFRASFREGTVGSLAAGRAPKEAVRGLLPKARCAHLATHGFFSEAAQAHPGLLSGLVLSGGEPLTALEVAGLELSAMDLATLSACETVLGEESGGEGLMGLQRAFAVAGCRSVVASLWSVEDAATSVLMERFYHHLWKGKKGKAEALRLAQLDVLRGPDLVEARHEALAGSVRGLRGAGIKAEKLLSGARRSPVAWWAAFVLSGDWR